MTSAMRVSCSVGVRFDLPRTDPRFASAYTNDPENTPPDQLVTEVILPVKPRE